MEGSMSGRLDPEQVIPGLGGLTVGDFWAWAYSDILENTARGMFAEFLVGVALDAVENVRPTDREGFDLRYGDQKIEVKASAYVQSRHQDAPPDIRFGIGESEGRDSEIDTHGTERTRPADCYVFCLFFEQDRDVANVLDVSQWQFYVLSTQRINDELGNQKSVGLGTIQSMTDPVHLGQIRESVELALLER
jgi:hypothetical protein